MSNIKSNWLGSKVSAPTKFRPASKGKIFTRSERITIIKAEKVRKAKKAASMEEIFKARAAALREREERESVFKGIQIRLDNPTSIIRTSKAGLYIQPRVNGSFGPKINL